MQFGYTFSRSVDNPTLMHMHRREFIAAAFAQGMVARGLMLVTSYGSGYSPTEFAQKDLEYTDALMQALDN